MVLFRLERRVVESHASSECYSQALPHGGRGVAPRDEHALACRWRCGVLPREVDVQVGRPRAKSWTAVGGERGARERSSALIRACSASRLAKSCRVVRVRVRVLGLLL